MIKGTSIKASTPWESVLVITGMKNTLNGKIFSHPNMIKVTIPFIGELKKLKYLAHLNPISLLRK